MQGHVGNLKLLREKYPPMMEFIGKLDCTQQSNYNGLGGVLEAGNVPANYTHLYIVHRVGSSTTAGSDADLALSINTNAGTTHFSQLRSATLTTSTAAEALAGAATNNIQRTRANTGFSTQTSPLVLFLPYYTNENMHKCVFAYNFLRTNTSSGGIRTRSMVGFLGSTVPIVRLVMVNSNTLGYADWDVYGIN